MYRATQLDLQRPVALKLIASPLTRAAQLSASIDHPNLIPIYETGELDGGMYVAMQYVDGTDLAAVIAREGGLAPRRAVEVSTQVAAGLEAARMRGLVHRPVEPADVLIGADGRVYVTGFATTGDGDADPRAEVLALGRLLFQAITGRPPSEADVRRPGVIVPPALEAVVHAAIAADPGARHDSAGELARAASAALEAPHPRSPGPAAVTPRRRPVLGAALAALLAAGFLGAAIAATGTADGGRAEAGAAPPSREPAEPRAVATIEVGRGPDDLTVDDAGSVWVTNARDDTLTRIEAAGGDVIGDPVPAGDDPDGVVAEKGTVWVASAKEDAVLRFDATDAGLVPGGTVAVGDLPEGISLGRQLGWVANIRSGTVSRIDRASPAVVGAPIGVGGHPTGIFVGEDSVWVTNNADGTVTRIDPATAEVIGEPIPVGSHPRGVVEGAGSVWVANARDGTVSRLDPGSGEPNGAPIEVGRNPRELAVGEGFVWVANSDDDSVTRIDPESGRVVGTPIPVGDHPIGIAVGGGAVWVANFRGDTVTRIEP